MTRKTKERLSYIASWTLFMAVDLIVVIGFIVITGGTS